MAGDRTQQSNPLQLGQTVYEVLDATVIATPLNAPASRYQRAVFNEAGGEVAESRDLTGQSRIRHVTADLDMHAATQNVYVLTDDGLEIIGSAGGRATAVSWPLPPDAALRVVGLDPTWTDRPHLQLLGRDAQGIFLRSLDCASGGLTAPLHLAGAHGTPVDALLVRRQLEVHVVLCTVNSGQVTLYDLGPTVLGPRPTVPPVIPSLALGAGQDSGAVSLTVASLDATSTDQQVAVAYADPQKVLHLTVAGWHKTALRQVAKMTPDLAFAKPEREKPIFRITAGDLLANGADQLVIGYAGVYQGSRGCAALLLFELETPRHGAPKLTRLSQYAAADIDPKGTPQPLASIDLHLAAGLFGEVLSVDRPQEADGTPGGVLGVLVVGGGSTLAQLLRGEASILGGLVPVDRINKSFPPLHDKPGPLQHRTELMRIGATTTEFVALASDVTGNSVVLGQPTLSQTSGKGQLVAVIQAPPFEDAVSTVKPVLTFGESSGAVKGCNVSSNKTWMLTDDAGQNLGLGHLSLRRNVSNSYGESFDKTDESSTSTLVHAVAQVTLNDLMVLYAMDYDVWTYPVYRKARQGKPDGSMAVVFPTTPSPVQTITPASTEDMGYRPRSQSGVLLSYVDVPHDGYKPDRLLFTLDSIPVSEDVGASVTYDYNKMTGETTNNSFTVHQSTTDSAGFSVSTTLLDYVPVNFGLDMSEAKSYTETDVKTTTLTHSTTLTVTLAAGSVKDIGYEYQITPYIYFHRTMGCLMVGYDVAQKGKAWESYYGIPQILLQPLQPNAHEPVLAGFSRSISFKKNTDGTVAVTVEIFNNGLSPVPEIVCEFYRGRPKTVDKKLTPTGPAIGSRTLPTLGGAQRATVTLDMTLAPKDQVVVKVYIKELPTSGKVYWGIYPASEYRTWKP